MPSVEQLRRMAKQTLTACRAERTRLDREIEVLERFANDTWFAGDPPVHRPAQLTPAPIPQQKHHTFTAAERAAISARMKAYHARRRAAQAGTNGKGNHWTPAMRARQSKLIRQRLAAIRQEKESRS